MWKLPRCALVVAFAAMPVLAMLTLIDGGLSRIAVGQSPAPEITSPGPFAVNEGTTAVTTLTADDDDTTSDNLTWTKTGGADRAKFALTANGVLSFAAAKDYEATDDADTDGAYAVTVQVSDGANTDSADLVVTLNNVIELTAISGPTSPSIGEHNFGRAGTYSASSEADRAGITWSLSGADAAHFSIDAPSGALRFQIDPVAPNLFKQAADYENPQDDGTDNTYNVTVTASVSGGSSNTLAVAVSVTNVDEDGELTLSATQPRTGTALTATLTDPDSVTAGTTSWQWERNDGREGWLAIGGATAASYTPTAADGDRYLRVTATYTDSFGASKTADAMTSHVVIAHRLSALTFHGLTGVTGDSRASYPAFDSNTLHYAARCTETVAMTVETENTNTRIAVNGVQRTSGQQFSVSGVGSEQEISIVLTGAAGGSTTYTVHCLDRESFPRMVTTKSAGATDELWLFRAKWWPPNRAFGALIAMDNNGVPRWHRIVEDNLQAYFTVHPDENSPFGFYSYSQEGSSFGRDGTEMVVLDKYFNLVKEEIHIRSPFNNTDGHDQLVLPNGDVIVIAYSRHSRDLRFLNQIYPSLTDGDGGSLDANESARDSAIQVQKINGRTVFNWSSWDHMSIADCVHRDTMREDYAHINSLSYYDGDIIAGFRGCSKILRIDLDTGNVVWRAGPSVNSREDWEAGRLLQSNRGPAPLEFVGDPRNGFSGQHGGEITRDGTFLVYDNATHCSLPANPIVREGGKLITECFERTRAVEYAFDLPNHELVFLREYRRPGEKQGGFGGHASPLPNGDWIISWSSASGIGPGLPATAVEVDPRTGVEQLSLDLQNVIGTWGTNGDPYHTRVSSVSPLALAPKIEDLGATVVSSPGFHGGATDRPAVVVSFNRPIVDPTSSSPSVVVSGATVTSVSAYTQSGAPANAYQFTLTPTGDTAISFSLRTGQACASAGICTADGAMLSAVPAAIQIGGPTTVSFGSAAYRASEGGSVNVQVRLGAAHQSPEAVVIPLSVGTASTALADEYSYAETVSFAKGETTKTFAVSVADDDLVEGDESIVLELGTLPTGLSAGSQSTTTVTLNDTDRATMSFSVGQTQVAEGGSTNLAFAITNGVTYQADQEITLSVSGSASDDDYALSETLTLFAGQTSANTSLSVVDDSLLEGTAESVVIRATIGEADTLIGTRTVTIPPSDLPEASTVSILPGADVAEAAAATFDLTRTASTSSSLSSPLTVALQVTPTDVVLSGSAPTHFTFAANEASAELSIGTRDDNLISDAGEVSVLIAASTSNPPAYLVDTSNSASVNVTDTDSPAFRIVPETADLAETRSLTVTVQTDGVVFAAPQTITVTLDGTGTGTSAAAPGVDYELRDNNGQVVSAPLELTLPARASSTRLRIMALPDSEDDAEETVVVDFEHNGLRIGTATLTLKEPPPPSVSTNFGGGGGGGGGGGAPAVIEPSDADLEYNKTRDLTELHADNDSPTDIWSDGSTIWIVNNSSSGADLIFAYDLLTAERQPDAEFELASRNRFSHGIWSDGETVWIADSGQDRLFAYQLADGARLEADDLELAERNRDPRGIWSDGETIYVLDSGKDALFLYNLEDGEQLAEHAFASLNKSPRGIWSDGVTFWVSDDGAKRLFAYEFDDDELTRNEDDYLEFTFRPLLKAGNSNPRGIWSNGDIMYVVDEQDAKVYTYNVPDAIQAALTALTLSDLDIGQFAPNTHEYQAEVSADATATATTVEATATQATATITIEPADSDGDPANGHQLTLGEAVTVTVAVTSADGNRTNTYSVTLPEIATNEPPVGSAIPALSLTAGGDSATITLTEYFSDPDGDPLEYALTVPESADVIGTELAEGVVTVEPVAAGEASFSLTATDGKLESAAIDVQVAVAAAPEPTPDPPIVETEDAAVIVNEVRIRARRLAEGRTEFALQARAAGESWGATMSPSQRIMPATAVVNRWLTSSPLALTTDEGEIEIRIAARPLADGQMEFAFQTRQAGSAWSDRQLPTARFLPANSEIGSWRNSSATTIEVAQ